MNRIEKRLEELKQENKKAFITYTTAGLPDLQTTAKLIFAQEEAGADIQRILIWLRASAKKNVRFQLCS